jgi:hypothetical protein
MGIADNPPGLDLIHLLEVVDDTAKGTLGGFGFQVSDMLTDEDVAGD